MGWTLRELTAERRFFEVFLGSHPDHQGDFEVLRLSASMPGAVRPQLLTALTRRAMLDHPNIRRLLPPVEQDNTTLVPLASLDGASLDVHADVIDGPFPLEQGMEYVMQACGGLGYAHSQGILHRDITPAALHITSNDRILLTGFGGGVAQTILQLFQPGSWMGNAAYVAPEVLHGDDPTPRSDVFSLAIVAYRILAGRLPYDLHDERNVAQVLGVVVDAQKSELPLASSLEPRVPVRVASALASCLAIDPSDRPKDAGEMAQLVVKAYTTALNKGEVASDVLETVASPEDVRAAISKAAADKATTGFIGQKLSGKYEITSLNHRDSNSLTFTARRVSDRERLRIRMLSRAVDDTVITRFRREAKLFARVDSEHMVRVVDFGEHAGHLFMVTEAAPGTALADALATGPLGEPRTLKLMADVVSALRATHEVDIVHRDLHPTKIFLDQQSTRITNLGFAALKDDAKDGETNTLVAQLTGFEHTVGDLTYVAPEVIANQRTSTSADFYSLGCLAYHCLAGRPPFSGTPVQILAGHIKKEPTPFGELEPSVNVQSRLERLVLQMLAKEAEDRPVLEDVEKELSKLNLSASDDMIALGAPKQASDHDFEEAGDDALMMVLGFSFLLGILLVGAWIIFG